MDSKEQSITEQTPAKGRPRKYTSLEEAEEANRLKNIESYYKKNKEEITPPKKGGRPRKYATLEEAEEAKRQRSLEYYKNNKQKCIQNAIKYKQKQTELLKVLKLEKKSEVTTN